MSGTVLPIRYTARVMIEADTPITVGTGRTGLDTDEQVALDANMLPVIPGTGLCGVLRSMAKGLVSNIEDMFGFQGKNSSEGCGSRLIISDAVMVGEGGLPQDGLSRIDWRSGFYSRFKALPIRDHCRISHTGVADAEGKGKFDEQVVFRGTRFIFEMVLQGDEQHRNDWNSLLSLLSSPLFRVGGGTRKGFGKLSTVKIEEKVFDLTQKIGLKEYLEQSSSLRDPVMSPDTVRFQESIARAKEGGYVEYDLHLVPEDFYCFGSGFGDSEVDDAFKTEEIIRWSSSGIPSFSEEMILVPATSVKGALSHRIAFHHNQINGVYSDSFSLEVEKYDDNYAVKTLFGYAKDDDGESGKQGQRGIVLFSDSFLRIKQSKILNHVSIDRFTGGSLDSALFDERVVADHEGALVIKLVVEKDGFDQLEDSIRIAFEKALKDIASGLLPLGGSVMRGHGSFTGSVLRNGKEL